MKVARTVKLSLASGDVDRVRAALNSSRYSLRQKKRLNVLWWFQRGLTLAEVSRRLRLEIGKVEEIRDRYLRLGLMVAVMGKGDSACYGQLPHEIEYYILELLQAEHPSWLERWTVNALREALVANRIVKSISPDRIRQILRANSIKLSDLENAASIPRVEESTLPIKEVGYPDLLPLIVEGKTRQQIADTLEISTHDVWLIMRSACKGSKSPRRMPTTR